jgi:hypothetical protein
MALISSAARSWWRGGPVPAHELRAHELLSVGVGDSMQTPVIVIRMCINFMLLYAQTDRIFRAGGARLSNSLHTHDKWAQP